MHPQMTRKPPFSSLFRTKRNGPTTDTLYQLSVQLWSEWRDLNPRHPAPKPMSDCSAEHLADSLTLSADPTITLRNFAALLLSGIPFSFWDYCGIGVCILKEISSAFSSNKGLWLRMTQKMSRINKDRPTSSVHRSIAGSQVPPFPAPFG